VVHEDLEEFEAAVEDYGQAIFIEPENVDPRINQALLYTTVGKYAPAISDMDLAVQVNHTYAKAYVVRTSALANLGLDAQSQADIDQAMSLGVDRAKAETTVAKSASSP
tara:strand:- start:166 stop:492 length:327 start_codon:yes stop_codon:yes gene_type:complete